MTEFERAKLVSFQCTIIGLTLFLSCIIPEIMRFSCKPEIPSWCYLRRGSRIHNFQWSILKGWPKVYNHVLSTYFAYIYLWSLTSYSIFSLWLWFPYCRRAKFVGFSGNMTPKVKISKNASLESTSLRRTAFIELSCVEIGSLGKSVLGKTKQKIKVTRPVYFTRRYDPTILGGFVDPP